LKPEYIVIHHSATADGQTVDWNAITNYHKNTLGYLDVGYHYGIERVNERWAIITGRAEDQAGAHTKQEGMNFKSIGICVIGNFDKRAPDKEALFLLEMLCADLCRRYQIPVSNIVPHSKYAAKTCPGNLFPLVALRESIAKRL
jgi:N-acetyl-anhydromuramyl-L-alanine amidase AmpD